MADVTVPPEALELADLIDRRLAEIEATRPSARNFDGWRAYHQKGKDLVDELVRDRGARYRLNGAHEGHFRFAGIACSCTSGEFNLLHAWSTKVRKLAPQSLYSQLQAGDGVVVKAWSHGERVGIIERRGRNDQLHAWKVHLDRPGWSGPMQLFATAIVRRATEAELQASIAKNGDPRP